MNRQKLTQQNGLSYREHEKLLEKIESLPYDHSQIRIYQKSIEELFSRYESQLGELSQTLADYTEVSLAIAKMQSLMVHRKYIPVKRKPFA